MLKNKEKIYPKNKDFVINAWDYRRMTAHKYKRIWQNCKPLWEKCFNCIQYILSYFLFFIFKNTFLSNKLCHSQPFCCTFLVVVVLYKKRNGLLLKDANWYISGMCFDDIVLLYYNVLQMVVKRIILWLNSLH